MTADDHGEADGPRRDEPSGELDRPRFRGRTHEVRPRRTWLGLAGLIAGWITLGVAVVIESRLVGGVGLVVLLASAVVAWRGGFFYAVVGHHTPAGVIQDLRENPVLEGPDPSDRSVSAPLAADLREEEGRRRVAVSRPYRRPSATKPAGLVLVLAGVYLLVSQWTVYADSATGNSGGARALAAGIVVAVAGSRILLAGRSIPASAVALVAGVGMVLLAVLADHAPASAAWGEGIAGGAIVLAAAVALSSR